MQDVCEKTEGCQSHNIHRVVAFQPFAPAALFCRVFLTLLMRRDATLEAAAWPSALVLRGLDLAWGATRLITYGVLAWVVLWPLKLRLGYFVKRLAQAYVRHYERRYGKARPGMPSRRAATTQ